MQRLDMFHAQMQCTEYGWHVWLIKILETFPWVFRFRVSRIRANDGNSTFSRFKTISINRLNVLSYPFNDFAQPFNALSYPFRDFAQPFNVSTYPFKDFAQPLNVVGISV